MANYSIKTTTYDEADTNSCGYVAKLLLSFRTAMAAMLRDTFVALN